MLTIDEIREYVDNYLINIMRRTMRVHGVFPLTMVRFVEDVKHPNGFHIDPISSNTNGFGIYDTEAYETTFKNDISAAASNPNVLAIVYALPFDDAEDEISKDHTGPFVFFGIHMRATDKSGAEISDARLMYYKTEKIGANDPSKDLWISELQDEYLLDYMVKKGIDPDELSEPEIEQVREEYVSTSWEHLKPEYYEQITNSLWGAVPRDVQEHPIDSPFKFDGDWKN